MVAGLYYKKAQLQKNSSQFLAINKGFLLAPYPFSIQFSGFWIIYFLDLGILAGGQWHFIVLNISPVTEIWDLKKYMFTQYLYVFFVEVSVLWVVFLMLSFKSSLHILDSSPLLNVFYKQCLFILVCGLSSHSLEAIYAQQRFVILIKLILSISLAFAFVLL